MKRAQLLFLVSFFSLCLLTTFSLLKLRDAHASARVAQENLTRCEGISNEIRQLRLQPQRASLDESTSAELTRRVEQAATDAEIALSDIIRIDPQPARRIGESSYLEQDTRIEVRKASLAQLTRFFLDTTAGSEQLEVTSLRLNAPRETVAEDQKELWSAEVTLTHLVFSPQSRRPR